MSPSSSQARPIGLSETRHYLRIDRSRLASLNRGDGSKLRLFPAYTAVWLYRFSHFLHRRRQIRLSWFLWKLNLRLTGADIDPAAELGGGLCIPYPAGVSITGSAGNNLTVMALVCVQCDQLKGSNENQLWPKLGENVVLQHHAVVCGTVTVSDGARIGAGGIVTCAVPARAVVEGPKTKVLAVKRPAVLSNPGRPLVSAGLTSGRYGIDQ